ncbi:rhodanese-like domain-containing protein [Mesobacterium pallidum]|uniref:rhodanese-like domain-containing protein n=1 Tax=Mesobacterium pallidum TaxID=2872037 RepID=UPI001EE1EBDD|nr:rhodanese-like domain-containing protein [Mesobacterium pallidum]
MLRTIASAIVTLVLSAGIALAQDVRITPDAASKTFAVGGTVHEIARNQDQSARLTGEFTKTSRACPPFCVQPMDAGPGVETIGELELLNFLETTVSGGRGLLVDARLPEWFQKGTIPGAVNIPFSTLDASNPYRDQILEALGGRKAGAGWDFSGALELALFCNGPWCGQSHVAIAALHSVGYPGEKMKYYRGGMQLWQLMGLTVKTP